MIKVKLLPFEKSKSPYISHSVFLVAQGQTLECLSQLQNFTPTKLASCGFNGGLDLQFACNCHRPIVYLYLHLNSIFIEVFFRVKGRIRSCGFLRIFTYTDDGLMSAPQGWESSPAGLETPAGARNRIKATVKIQRNRPFRILPLI